MTTLSIYNALTVRAISLRALSYNTDKDTVLVAGTRHEVESFCHGYNLAATEYQLVPEQLIGDNFSIHVLAIK